MKTTRRRSVSLALVLAGLAIGPTLGASAQLAPDRTYYGVGRPVPFSAKIPEGKSGDPSVQLFTHGAKEPVATQSIAPGRIDIAALFPQIWKDQKPVVLYAQLVVGAERIGAPVVLQPLVEGAKAVPAGRAITWQSGPFGPYSGLRAYVDQNVVLETTAGEITLQMRADQAPNTVWNFLELVRGGFYTDILFHRIVAKLPNGNPFVIQVGDPTGTGGGGPGYNIDLEQSKLPHDFGVISMAREQDPNTNGSQVFLCLSRDGTSFLDGNYCAFGQTIAGGDVIKQIAATPTREGDRPADEANGPKIKSARLVDAAPFGAGPEPVAKGAEAKPAGR
jgi:peptidyl-prolyl cis-trans isomerase B (cyclophilin B)